MPAAPIAPGGGQLTPGLGPPLVTGPGDRVFGPITPAYGPTLPVPGPGFVMPVILTPGIGPNGPGPIDCRRPETSVGERSSVPYSFTGGYATPNGVTGFIGPAADSLQRPTAWYVRAAGSNTNGGSSTSLTPDRTGTDMVTNVGFCTVTSATANFTPADIGKGIYIANTTPVWAKIVAVTSTTTAVLNLPTQNGQSGITWNIGGAWASLAPLANPNSPFSTSPQSGDTIYIGAGTYRAVYTITSSYGSSWLLTGNTLRNPNTFSFNGYLNIVGDVTGQYTGDAGMVQLTAYTTNDKTAPTATAVINFAGKSNFRFSNIFLVGGSNAGGGMIQSVSTGTMNVQWLSCAFLLGNTASGFLVNWLGGVAQPANWLFDRCFFSGSSSNGGMNIGYNTGGTYDWDLYWTVQNSTFVNGTSPSVFISGTAGGVGKANGVRLLNVYGGATTLLKCNLLVLSTIFPSYVYGCFAQTGTGNAVNAGLLGQIVEDYNLFVSSAPRTLVTAGAHSISNGSYSPLYHFGQEATWGGLMREFGEPLASSPLLAFGYPDGSFAAYDLLGRPRPAGGSSFLPAVGALERGSTAVQATTPAPAAGTHVWQGTGPWYQDFLLPVSAQATTLAMDVQRDASYAGALPQFQILANGALGVAAQAVTDTGGTGSNNTITSAAFTPSGTGWITVRMYSRDLSGASVVSFSNVVIT